MRTLYSKFTTKSFRLISALFFLIGDICFTGYLYNTLRTDLTILMDNPMFHELFQKSMQEQGLELPPGIGEDILQIFLQSIVLFLVLFVLFHAIIYLFYINEKRFSYLYLRVISAGGALSALFIIVTKITISPLISLGFLLLGLLYVFNFSGFFYFPILPKKKKVS
jgi:hypothetical protein